MTLQSIAQESHLNVQKTVTMKTACSAMEEEVIVTEVAAALEQNDAVFFGGPQHFRLLQLATLRTVAAKPCIAAPLRHQSYTLG